MPYHTTYLVSRTTRETISVVADSAEEARAIVKEMTEDGEEFRRDQIVSRSFTVGRPRRA